MTVAHNNITWPLSLGQCSPEVPEALLPSHFRDLQDAEAEQGCPWRTAPKKEGSQPLGGGLNFKMHFKESWGAAARSS